MMLQPTEYVNRNRVYKADVVVYSPDEYRIELIVQVLDNPSPDEMDMAVEELKKVMVWVSSYNGLIVTPDFVYVYRDSFKDSPDSIELRGKPLPTMSVIETVAGNVDTSNPNDLRQAITSWVYVLSTHWYQAVSSDEDIAFAFLPSIAADVSDGHVRINETIHYV